MKVLDDLSAFYLSRAPNMAGGATSEFEVGNLDFWTLNEISPIYYAMITEDGVEIIEGFDAPPKDSGNYGGLLLQRKVDGSIRVLSPKAATAEIEQMISTGNFYRVTLKLK